VARQWQDEDIVDFLDSIEAPVVLSNLLPDAADVPLMAASELRQWLSASKQNEPSFSVGLRLLDICLSDNKFDDDELEGIRLLPLENSSFAYFGSGESEKWFVRENDEPLFNSIRNLIESSTPNASKNFNQYFVRTQGLVPDCSKALGELAENGSYNLIEWSGQQLTFVLESFCPFNVWKTDPAKILQSNRELVRAFLISVSNLPREQVTTLTMLC